MATLTFTKTTSHTLVHKQASNNVVGSFVRTNLHLGGRQTSFSPLTVRCRTTKGVETASPQKGPASVKLIDGFEPAVLTPPKDLKRKDFAPSFKFGASTSALQTEGNGKEGGRGPSSWDFMIKADQGFQATDSYHRYKADVQLLKEMGMDSYRFSISWSRILPQGVGEPNQEGIQFYNNLIDELLANDIEPIVTLFHFDMPTALEKKYGGLLGAQVIEDFKNYANICFEAFGDRVKYWSTVNEPYVYASGAYRSDPFKATHNIILLHAHTAKLYHDKYKKQKGKIGITLPCQWFVPLTQDPKDIDAAQKQLDFMLGWFMDPFFKGDYPDSLKVIVTGLPTFTSTEKDLLKTSCDYIGLNYYTARYASGTYTVDAMSGTIQAQYNQHKEDLAGKPIGTKCKGQPDIYVYPPGLKNLILYVTAKYNRPELIVTENGVPDAPEIKESVKSAIDNKNIDQLKASFLDDYRIDHAEKHLQGVREAISQGADVRGYFVWTLMDNMEVGAGYDCRFGLNYTDYLDNLKRYPKKSAMWFKYFLSGKFDEPQPGKNN